MNIYVIFKHSFGSLPVVRLPILKGVLKVVHGVLAPLQASLG